MDLEQPAGAPMVSSARSSSSMAAGDAPQLADVRTLTEALMAEVRAFGRRPKLVRSTSPESTAERNLAQRINKARVARRLTVEHEAELTAMDALQPAGDAPQLAHDRATSVMHAIRAAGRLTAEHEAPELAEDDMADVRTLGRAPKLVRGKDAEQIAERSLAKRLCRARTAGHLTAEHESELTAMDVEQPAGDAPQLAAGDASQLAQDVMADVRTLGRVTATSCY